MFSCFKREKSSSFDQFQLVDTYYLIILFIFFIDRHQKIFKNHPNKETYSISHPLNRDSFEFRENTDKLPPDEETFSISYSLNISDIYIYTWKYMKIILHWIQFLNEKSSSSKYYFQIIILKIIRIKYQKNFSLSEPAIQYSISY